MKKITYVSGSKVSDIHIRQALSLDRVSYEECYQLSEQTCIDYHKKNDKIYIMTIDEEDGKVIGYINFSPITESTYNEIKSGMYIDTIISADNIAVYQDNIRCFGYLSSMVVHPDYRQNGYATEMLTILRKFIVGLAQNHNIFFNSIVADAVTPVGIHILQKLGFEYIRQSNHQSGIMEMDLFSDKSPITEYNTELKTIYKGVTKDV